MKMREEVVNMREFIGKTTIVVTHNIVDAPVDDRFARRADLNGITDLASTLPP